MNEIEKPLIIESFKKKEIENCIYNIRGQQVMLDSDVAFFFGIETRVLNQQMKRNIERFPEDFCFQLNSYEFKNLMSQNVISSYGGRRKLPYMYTEHGVIALAGVIKSEIAAKMSVEIARKFIQMRKFVLENSDLLLTLAKLQNRQLEFEDEINKRFDEIIKQISRADLPKESVFYAGQFYDAYEFVASLIRKANKNIVLIDPYCDSKAFKYLKNRKDGVSITIINSSNSKLTIEDIETFKSQYCDIKVITRDDIHDRYIIIDNEEYYLLGTSLNYMGKKMFTIAKIEDIYSFDRLGIKHI